MTKPFQKPETDLPLIQILPNVLTIIAICAGLSAIRFGILGNHKLAVLLIMAACILDGLDGRIARLLGSDSKLGAELDSLADFLNFGVAPPLILYFWGLKELANAGWIAVLVFAVCCVLRLARFNVSNKSDDTDPESAYFEGVPAPAGALLVMLPMYVFFGFANAPMLPGYAVSAYMVFVGLLLISRVPTWSFKATRIAREHVKFILVGVAIGGAALLTFAWITLIVLCLGYVSMVIWAWLDRTPPAKQ